MYLGTHLKCLRYSRVDLRRLLPPSDASSSLAKKYLGSVQLTCMQLSAPCQPQRLNGHDVHDSRQKRNAVQVMKSSLHCNLLPQGSMKRTASGVAADEGVKRSADRKRKAKERLQLQNHKRHRQARGGFGWEGEMRHEDIRTNV